MAAQFFPRAVGAGAGAAGAVGAVGVSGLGPCWLGPAPPDAPRPPPPPLDGSGLRYLPRDATRLPRTPVWARPPVPRWARSPSPQPPPPPPRPPTRRRRRLSVWAATAPVRGAASERKHLVLPNFLASVCAPPRRRRRASKAKAKAKEEQKAKQKKRQSPVQSATPRPATRAAAPHALAHAHALPLPRPRPRRLRARSSWRDLARLVAAETAALHREDSEERLWRSKGGPWRATVAERAAAVAAAAAAQAVGVGAGAGGEPEARREARRPRKSIPLEREEAAESACGASDSPVATLSLLQAVTSTLPALRPRAHLRLALDGSRPPTKTLGLQTCKPFDYLTNKPESMEKLLMDARTVPSKYTYIREKIMGTRNYMKVFFPPEWMHAYCRARRRPMELFPNYAQRTRRARVIGEISLVEFVDKVMAFLQEAEEKERLAESQAGHADTPTRLGRARAGPDDWLGAGDEGQQRDDDDDDDDEDLIEADEQ